jgi:hypothetical protein
MAEPLAPSGEKLKRGVKMPTGRGWRLLTPGKTNKRLKASLLQTFKVGSERLAVFHVTDKRENKN